MSSPHLWVAGIGSRQTPPAYCKVIRTLAADLATCGIGIRSGNALGADQAWEEGARSAGGSVVSFLAEKKAHCQGIALNELPPAIQEQAMGLARQFHPAWNRLGAYARKLMARNACQVLGEDLDDPVAGVLCWAKGSVITPSGIASVQGGTGLAVRLAHDRGIPVLNLEVPVHLEHARRWHHSPEKTIKHLFDLPQGEFS